MIDDIRTIVWKEWRETLFQCNITGNEKLLRAALAIVIFGLILWRSGPLLVSTPQVFLAPSFLPLFFLSAIVADSFAGERERHTLETLLASQLSDETILLGKLSAAVLLIWTVVAALVLAALVSVSIMARGIPSSTFHMDTLAPAVVLYCLLALAIGCACVLVSLRASGVRRAIQIMNIGMLVVFFTLIYLNSVLPIEWKAPLARAFQKENIFNTEVIAGAILIFASALLFSAARLRFKRARLLLD